MPKRTANARTQKGGRKKRPKRSSPHVPSLKKTEIGRIQQMVKEKLSVRLIAERTGFSKSVVGRVRRNMKDEVSQNKGGRKKLLTDRDRRKIVSLVRGGKPLSARKVVAVMRNDHGVVCSERTVRRSLVMSGFRAKKKVKKPQISKKNIKERLDFATSHEHWTFDDWSKVIWSDESKINRIGSDGCKWCWVSPNEKLSDRTVSPTVKHGGGSVMVWGCFTTLGVGSLCKIDGKMDSLLYRSILEDDLMETIEYYDLDCADVIFQQDNDPKHTSKLVGSWLEMQEFEVMKWPAQSPDLNPIENLWSEVKRRLMEYEDFPSGIIELWQRVQETWNKISEDTCRKLVASMPERMAAVIKAKGKWTKF